MSSEKGKKFLPNYFDFPLLSIIIFLLAFGLVMIYSTSSYSAAIENEGDGFFYCRKQLISIGVGFAAMLFTSFFRYDIYKKLSLFIYSGSCLLVLMVLTPLGKKVNGARRWIEISGFTIQPSEFVKIAVIIVVAAFIAAIAEKNNAMLKTWRSTFIPLIPAGISAAMLYFITDNLSSAIIVGGIAFFVMLIATKGNYRPYILLAIVVLAAVFVVLGFSKGWFVKDGQVDFRGARILAWLDPENDPQGDSFQTLQSLYGIGSGGVLGKGLGKSIQKLGFLPEAQNDMIFAIICEELGLCGGFAVIVLFLLLLWRLSFIASHCRDTFGILLVTGIFVHIALQVIINIAVVTNVIPNTGITLPFISYGGSSIIALMMEMGIAINVSFHCKFDPDEFRIGKKKLKKADFQVVKEQDREEE